MPRSEILWTEQSLNALRVRSGFRQRGVDMTRLETFTDAAFAFAVTLLVISVDDVPQSYPEFIEALKRIPAFIASFMQLMIFWWGHHIWSRRYGLEDGWSVALSLTLVAIVLIYIYPLRVIFDAFFSNASGGLLPGPFDLTAPEVGTLFIVFGAGFTGLSALIVALFLRGLSQADPLALNAREQLETRADIIGWSLVAGTGLASMLCALLLPPELSPAAGFAYWSLVATMPLLGVWLKRQRRALRHDANAEDPA